MRTVGEVAAIVGVSVRTLHHYDTIGLVTPSGRSHSGYRVYSGADIERLHGVLVYRELGFALDDIAGLLDATEADTNEQLRRQRNLLTERIERLTRVVGSIDKMLESKAMNTQLTTAEMKEIFGDQWEQSWADEAEQRWGDSDAWKQARRRQANLSKQDWVRVKAEGDALTAAFADAKRRGVVPGSDEANALAERHRAALQQWYDCSHEKQVCVAQLYVSDGRFTQTYDQHEPGLAEWVRDIVVANAEAQ